jgi:DUF917 family protein
MIRIGVDVGGTNTDAVVMRDTAFLAGNKSPTTPDVISGVRSAIAAALEGADMRAAQVDAVMVGMAMVGLYPVTAGKCGDYLIKGSLTMAHEIGQIMEENGAEATASIAETFGGATLFRGRVRDVERISDGGFTKGKVRLEGQGDFRNREAVLQFQNEFLSAQEGDTVLATTPDQITLLDANTGEAVTTEMVKYGLSVNVLGLPCDPIWRSEEGLKLVGPDYFGLGVPYSPL